MLRIVTNTKERAIEKVYDDVDGVELIAGEDYEEVDSDA